MTRGFASSTVKNDGTYAHAVVENPRANEYHPSIRTSSAVRSSVPLTSWDIAGLPTNQASCLPSLSVSRTTARQSAITRITQISEMNESSVTLLRLRS